MDNTPPGKRDYVWSIDSVDYGTLPGTIQLESIWGSSASDVWGAGYTPGVRDCLWHYDGVKWSRATGGTPITTAGDGSKIVGRLWGTSSSDVWAFGDKIFSKPVFHGEAFVMHYDGSSWTDATGSLTSLASGIFDVYGRGKDDFWLMAYEYMVHYKQGVWNKFNIGDSTLGSGITVNQDNVYAIAYDISVGGNRVILARINNNQLFIDDQTTIIGGSGGYSGKFELGKPWISNGKLYTAWQRISEANISVNGVVDSSSWRTILSLPTAQFFINTFFQTSKNIFATGYPNLLYHYNGTDWMNIVIDVPNKPVTDGEYSSVWTNGTEIFVCDKDNGVVYHGR